MLSSSAVVLIGPAITAHRIFSGLVPIVLIALAVGLWRLASPSEDRTHSRRLWAAFDILGLILLLVAVRVYVLTHLSINAVSNDMHYWVTLYGQLNRGENPYGVILSDGWYPNWAPFWVQIVYGLGQLAQAEHWSLIRTINGALVATEVAIVILLYLTLAARAPRRRAVLLILGGIIFNPITILLVCVHGNFDVLVGLWVLLFVIALVRWAESRDPLDWVAATLWLGLGVLTKTVPVILASLLAVDWRRLRPIALLQGALLIFGPATLALSVVYMLSPAEVTHVLVYRSYPGYFGATGLLHIAGRDDLVGMYAYLSEVAIAGAGLAILFWAALRAAEHPRRLELATAILLIAVPVLGPGYAPQYAYWFLPLLVLAFDSVKRGVKVVIAVWFLIAVVAYVGEYAFIPGYGGFLAPVVHLPIGSLSISGFQSGITLWRLPLFVAYLALLLSLTASVLDLTWLPGPRHREDPDAVILRRRAADQPTDTGRASATR
jgi:hypothetical protein